MAELSFEEGVRWRHELAYAKSSPTEEYLCGQFAERLRRVIEQPVPTRTDPGAEYQRGYAAGLAAASLCVRCRSYSDEELRSLQTRACVVGPLTLMSDDRIEPLDSQERLYAGQHRLLTALLVAYPSCAGWGTLVGKEPHRDSDRHPIRTQVLRLRPKLARYGLGIEAAAGIGYRLVVA